MARRLPRLSVGPVHCCSSCYAAGAAEVLEAARGSMPPLTAAASWGDPRV